MKKIVCLVTGHATLGATRRATGTYLPELAWPYEVFVHAGYQVEVASPQGGSAPLDPGSYAEILSPYLPFLEQTLSFEQIQVDTYEAFFLVGGHGVMWDLPTHPSLQALLTAAWQHHKVLAAVCHGPAGLLHLERPEGGVLLEGKHLTEFSNQEEQALGLERVVPFLIEDALREAGAHYSCAAAWQPHVIRDGNLITGQNPASVPGVAQAVCALLDEATHPASLEQEVGG